MLTVCMFVCSPITAIQKDAGQFAGKYRSGYWPVPVKLPNGTLRPVGKYHSCRRCVPCLRAIENSHFTIFYKILLHIHSYYLIYAYF